jgi:hypothetical protein
MTTPWAKWTDWAGAGKSTGLRENKKEKRIRELDCRGKWAELTCAGQGD